jgi:hypothetical protein
MSKHFCSSMLLWRCLPHLIGMGLVITPLDTPRRFHPLAQPLGAPQKLGGRELVWRFDGGDITSDWLIDDLANVAQYGRGDPASAEPQMRCEVVRGLAAPIFPSLVPKHLSETALNGGLRYHTHRLRAEGPHRAARGQRSNRGNRLNRARVHRSSKRLSGKVHLGEAEFGP